mgnify:CR=1 FL=1
MTKAAQGPAGRARRVRRDEGPSATTRLMIVGVVSLGLAAGLFFFRDQINEVLLNVANIEGGVEALDAAYSWTELQLQDDSFYDPFRQTLDAAGVEIESLLEE